MDKNNYEKFFNYSEDKKTFSLKPEFKKNLTSFLKSDMFEFIQAFLEDLRNGWLRQILAEKLEDMEDKQIANRVIKLKAKAEAITEILSTLNQWEVGEQIEDKDKKSSGGSEDGRTKKK